MQTDLAQHMLVYMLHVQHDAIFQGGCTDMCQAFVTDIKHACAAGHSVCQIWH